VAHTVRRYDRLEFGGGPVGRDAPGAPRTPGNPRGNPRHRDVAHTVRRYDRLEFGGGPVGRDAPGAPRTPGNPRHPRTAEGGMAADP